VRDNTETISTRRFKLPASHPVPAKPCIDAADVHRFEQPDEGDPATKIIRHDNSKDGMIAVLAASANDALARSPL
jgi:hypothetical protein